MKRILLLSLLALLLPVITVAQESISEKTSGMEKYEGFFNYWWDDDTGKIWLEIDKLDQEFIYVNSMAAGVGSNDIGLDRSQLGNTRIVKFVRVGPKILMVQPNYDYRASSENRLEKKSIEEAFAQSTLFGFEIAVREGERVLIDITDFLMQDAHGVADRLRRSDQGNYSVDQSRSAIHLPGTFNFPKNSEFETMLTFTGSGAGGNLRSVTPSADAITVRLHHSFVELPDDGYQPRELDPRSGFFGISYQDYSTPIGEDMTKRYAVRHRLEKKNPEADVSEAVEPIVFYLDNGTPEPVRTALLEGGRWWNEAFEAAGYKDAFQLKVLPDDAHPLDVRYNVINWVHRSTRGWSYGSSVVDPRTGEIIKGNVLLGSLRVRQDYMIAEGLLAPYEEGAEPDPEMLEMALNRIRQLSAHEIGHTLGIAHNFAASVNDLASVMDYPHPMVSIEDDESLSLANAYDIGIGEWDKRAVIWGYQDFPEDVDEEEALEEIILETIDQGHLYLSDEVARPQSGSHPDAHLWEYGSDVVSQLDHILEVRKIALDNFGEKNIRMGRAMGNLRDVLVPIYLFHRYQTEATVKLIGGMDFAYQMRGDGQPGPAVVDADVQRTALDEMLKTLQAETLALPEHLLDLIPPKPAGMSATRENFRGYTSPAIDPIAMAEVAAGHSASLIFNPERAARLTLQSARNSEYPDLHEVIMEVIHNTILDDEKEGYLGSVQRAINVSVLRNFIQLAGNQNASPDVQALTRMMLSHIQGQLADKAEGDSDMIWKAHYSESSRMIENFLSDAESFSVPPAPYTPPGSPIGSGVMNMDLLMCEF
ncbi:zinc-dependent metalloprotease [Rhodohalobacter sp.]|uniref:zinc-dependent metalloprotease n=1 Tax=Rhodohalobacter sp. TaxID=1974210 RepID=UPI002ACD80C2|nr:zinc-dependent metalloprotease [Rhodohalobacter sp.]MDZ7755651.1 zinc-dependent metalloprotease [Rhodohalobacter sp.]